ncbi:hypothetical protein GCM10011611_26880 [Aliidongia dinghuensis]|uniref:Pilus assembly protein CpaD n=1 Tax=Aliidongia dinghuensis TaxID=1867774 RepID=A0A8J2YTM9_9PROT|nr:CpaD family pilus assembly lipoprotein [Aliidongia dinghuensis]GGF19568.1 hypothetical protein GCM10011611_26880 [Aliidongia dinghuensis]
MTPTTLKRATAAVLPLAAVLGLAVGLAACSRNSDEQPVTELSQTNQAQVERHEQQFIVPASAGKAGLSAAYRRGFDQFLAEAAAGRPQLVHLTLFGGAPETAALLRQAAIADGLNPAKITIRPVAATGAAAASTALQTTAVAATYQLVMPSCARRSVDTFSNSQNPAWSDFGCSVNSSLAAQVEDPHDLVRGEEGGETDGALTNAAIDRLMQDKVKPLDLHNISSVGSGGSSGGGSGGSGGGSGGGGSP